MSRFIAALLGLASVVWLAVASATIPAQAQSPLNLNIQTLTNNQFPQMSVDVVVDENGLALPSLTSNNFKILEDTRAQAITPRVEQTSSHRGLAISLLLDFDPNGNRALYRPMQEWSQLLLDQMNLGAATDDISHVVEVRASSGTVMTPYTADVVAAKNGIRQLVIEDLEARQVNDSLLEILNSDAEGRRQIIVVIGAGGDVLDLNPVIDRVLQRDAVVHTVTFSDLADTTYLETLARNTRGQFIPNPENVALQDFAAQIFSAFNLRYRLTYRSQLHQTDQELHTATVIVNSGNAQAEDSATFAFPQNDVVPAFNSLPLQWSITLLLGIILLALLVKLYRMA